MQTNRHSISTTIAGGVAYITLNRPEKYNSFYREMALELQERLDDCAANRDIRCVYLTGSGKAFCAGQDLTEATREDGPSLEEIVDRHYNPIILRLRQLKKPVIAAVNGVAAGAGANIALACDIVVAAESATFIQAFSKIGLIPDSGGTYFLPRLIGWQRASALMMTGEKLSAAEAQTIGMVYKWYPDSDFPTTSKQLAEYLATMPTKGLALTKELLQQSAHTQLEDQLEREKEFQVRAGNTRDFREGVKAFMEKRNPEFTGN